MTRINVGIRPSELPDKLLLAEHREIKRIPNVVKSGKFSLEGQPFNFTLGKGHVKFFYDKLTYLQSRYISIYQECINRGFNVTNYIDAWSDIPRRYMGIYIPTKDDRKLLIERIESKGFKLLKQQTNESDNV